MALLNASSPAEVAPVTSHASASPASSSTTSPAPTTAPVRPTYEAPKRTTIGPDTGQAAKGRYLKTGFILKLGGKKAFGQKWQLRKCTVTTNGDLEWYIPDPNVRFYDGQRQFKYFANSRLAPTTRIKK
jgi:hypothetical protein